MIGTPNWSAKLTRAEISYAVAIIPTAPLKELVSEASLLVSDRFKNANIIDNERFPAHISLFLAGTDRKLLPLLSKSLINAIASFRGMQFEATKLLLEAPGFITLSCGSDALTRGSEAVTHVCSQHHRAHPRYRPRLIERWPRLKRADQELLEQYGTYKVGNGFRPHLSIAQVSESDSQEAYRLVEKKITPPILSGVEEIQLVDIGHQNEKWDVIGSWAGV